MSTQLIGKKVIVLGNIFAKQAQGAHIFSIDIETKKALLKLDFPFEHMGVIYTYIVASPRLSSDNFEKLEIERKIGCSLIWIPDSIFNPKKPMDLTWWRGGAAAISDVLTS